MARDMNDLDYGKRRPKRRKRSKLLRLGGLLLIVLIILIACLPMIATNRGLLVGTINKFAGIAPLKIDLQSAKAGWLSPVSATGIELKDADGTVLAKIASIETQKSLTSWIIDSMNLGKVTVRGVEAVVVASNGTSNLEQALGPLMPPTEPVDAPEPTSAGATPRGNIELVDAKLMLMELGRPEQWIVQVPSASVTLPEPGQWLGPVSIDAGIGDASGTVAGGPGRIQASFRQQAATESSIATANTPVFELQAVAQQIPIAFWHIVRARLPELPIEQLDGRVSVQLAGTLTSAENWSVEVRQFESQQVQIVAPELLGPEPAKLNSIAMLGRASLDGSLLRVEQTQLNCDFAAASADVAIPWPLQMPTMSDPFLRGATVSARGRVDLPKLVLAAATLVPVRDDTQLLSGVADFTLLQTIDDSGQPDARATLQLADLKATNAGQTLAWQEPLTVDVGASRGPNGPRFSASAMAEFVNLQGAGDIQSGALAGTMDLSKLHQRLSEWMELPVRTMSGSADLDLKWQMVSENQVAAEGQLKTTPVSFATAAGNEIQEPAWNGSLNATAILAGGAPSTISSAKLTLVSDVEELKVDLQEPLAIGTPAAGAPIVPPAAFTVDLSGDLAKWLRRGTVWLEQPPEIELGGQVNLAVQGRLDAMHVELTDANWNGRNVAVRTASASFAEPKLVGNFKGLVDTNNLTRLAIESLQVQAASFSLLAKDAAQPDSSRVGQAIFLVDLNQLLKSVDTSTAGNSQTADATPQTQMSATGRVQGQLDWQVNTENAAFALRAKGEKLVVLSKPPEAIAPSPLWEEPEVGVALNGQWVAADNGLQLSGIRMQTPWASYEGSLSYESGTAASETANVAAELPGAATLPPSMHSVVMKGKVVYDSAVLSQKIAPMTGNQVQLVGQQTVPIDVTWNGSSDPNTSVLAGLQAATRLGWQQARIAGIELGAADVPVQVQYGQLTTAAEIPVSGGMLRWDVESDLTAETLVLRQKPMTVLENVAITEQMCQGWLKYVTPLLAEATSVDGRLSLRLDQADLTPAEPQKQTVQGQLIVHQAQVGPGPLSNQVIGLVKQLDAIRKQEFTQAVSTQRVWMQLPQQNIDFQMIQGRVMHRNLNVKVGDASISTAGSVGVDGTMEMVATMPIPDDWVQKSPLLAGMQGQSLQFPVRGTLSQPKVDAELLKSFGRQAIQGAAQGALQQGLSRGLEKLFGGQKP